MNNVASNHARETTTQTDSNEDQTDDDMPDLDDDSHSSGDEHAQSAPNLVRPSAFCVNPKL